MIIKGYDSIDELLQEETAEIEDYESAKEANDRYTKDSFKEQL